MRTKRGLFLALGLALLAAVTLTTGLAVGQDEALKKRLLELNNVTGNDALIATIVDLAKDQEAGKKLVAAAREMVKGKKRDEVFNSNATTILARVALGVKDFVASEEFFRLNIDQARSLESSQKLITGYAGLVGVLVESKKFEEAEKAFKEFAELELGENADPLKEGLRRRMALLLARQGQVERANEIVDALLREDPTNPLTLELKGRVLQEAGKLDEAVTAYEKLIETVRMNRRIPQKIRDQFADDLRYRLSGLYVDLKKIDKAAEVLKVLIEKEPDNATYPNDLGFIWADNDMNLDEAEKLVRKALELDAAARKKSPDFDPKNDKENPSYLDSLGWVLFKKKQYAESRKYLEQALEQEEGKHLEIYDHLGDTLMKLNEKKLAIDAYKKGIASATDTRRDKARKVAVEKKIADVEK